MSKYSLDITSKNKPFINIEVENDRVLLGAYESGKIERNMLPLKLFSGMVRTYRKLMSLLKVK